MNVQDDDVSVQCVAAVGLAVVDHVYMIDVFPSKPEKYFASSARDLVGGIAANAAVAIARLGARAKLVGRIGDDSSGRLITSELTAANVELDCLVTVNGRSSPTSAVLVDSKGERVIINHKSNDLFADPPLIATNSLSDVTAVLADLRWTAGTLEVFSWAHNRGIPTVLDFDLCPEEVPVQILEKTSHIILGESALRQHARTNDLAQAMALIKTLNLSTSIAVTAGAQGVWFLNNDGEPEHISSRKVDVVNTLGAGDVFHGAAALAISQGQSFENALRFANDVAAVRVSSNSPNHFPSREDVKNFYRITQ